MPASPDAAHPAPLPPTFDERTAFLEYECGLSREEAEAQARSETRKAETEVLAPAPSVWRPPLPTADGLALWRAGLARLTSIDPDRFPDAVGYRVGEWAEVYARATAFLDQFGSTA
ncbi:hypothetical protein MKK69_22060, partial [Methylobacterium sp. J-026]|uniref:hypothetical protein n=1 Tax=Methylobacterium sp. J-026 TaxID=2836624 RepID=UPI001FBA6572